MLKIIKKNLNLIILVVLLKIFSSSLNDFIATSDEIKISMDNRLIETEDLTNPIKDFNNNKKFILVKRSQNKPNIEIKAEKREVKVAKFRNPAAGSSSITKLGLVTGYGDTTQDTEGHAYVAAIRAGSGNQTSLYLETFHDGGSQEQFRATHRDGEFLWNGDVR